MTKNKLLLLLALLLTAVTGAWAQSTPTEVSTFADLQTALSAGNNVKLTANISFTTSITISGTKKITIDGNGKTMSGPSTRAFSISSGNTLVINNATLDNFDLNAGGGAIRNYGTLVLDGCTVSNNHTDGYNQGGGAIENQGTLYASNTTFSGNYSSEIGGAINNYKGSLYLSGCTFTNNYTTSSNANYGGAIGNNSSNTLVLVNCTFSGNKYGGSNGTAGDLGVYRTPGTYAIAGCTGIAIAGATLTTYQYGTATLDFSDLSAISFTYDQSDTPIALPAVTANLANGAYWATFYSNAGNYQAPDGTQVFAVNLNTTTAEITMTEIPNRIALSGKGVVMKQATESSEPTTTITMTKTETAPDGDYSGSSLTGTMTDITNPDYGHIYVLNKGTQGVGFYKLKSGKTIDANKAYLTYSGDLARQFFLFDEATGIESIDHSPLTIDHSVYDLQGRRVAQPTKGLYIVNGKKVIIK